MSWGNCGGGDNPGVGHQGPTGPGSGGPSEREREKEDKQENTEQNCAGNPVLIATGTKYQVEHDFTVANSLLGFGRLYFQRSRHEGSLGKIWRTSYDYQLAVQANEIGVKQGLTISTPDGRQQYFYPVAGTQYWLDSNGKLADLLTTESGDWVFKQGEVTFNFNAKGQLIAMSNDNEAINLLYQHGRLAEVVSTTHRSIQFSYHDSGLLSQVTDANGAAYTYDYSHNGLLSQVSFPGGNHKRYFYEDQRHPSALTAIDINDKNYASWQYDEQGRAISSEHADGAERTEFAYLGDLKTTVTNALGKQTTYQFTEINGQKVATEITGHAGNYCSSANQGYEYDDYGRQTSQTDWNGFVTTTAYNERGLITESVLGAGSASTISKQTEWHATLDKPAKVTTAGSITEFSYADNGDLTLKLQTDRLTGEQRQWRYDYAYHDNRMLAKLTIDGPRDDVSDITVTRFDLQGNTLSQTNALGHQVQYGDYDQMGNPGYKVNINGVTTEFDYDARGRMLESRLLTATPAITRYQYNAMGQLIKTTRPKGDSYQYEYDAAYRKISESDAQGQTKRWLLDAAGNALESSITGESHAWQIETCLSSAACLLNATQITEQVDDYRQQRVFDSLSRVVESRESGSLNSRNEYDVQGNLLSTTDASGNQIHFSYDQFNRKIAQTNALGHSSTFAYNAQGQLSTVTDARGNVTEYQYNGFGEKVAQVSPDGGTNQYQYLAGLMISETTANGIVRQYKYDPLNRLSEVSENFQAVFSYVYDSCNYGIGKLCQTQQDDDNHSRYSYQPSGQLFELRSRIDGNEYVQQWQYDLNGNITERYMPSGQRVKSWYNRNNRLSYINYNDQALGWDFDYLAFGPVKAWTSANHLKHGIEYTQQRQVSQIVTSNVQHLQYQYDEVGNISAWFNHAQHFNQSFAYDALGQITSIDNSDGWQDISYDAIGNRLSLTTQTDSDWYRSAFDSNRLLAITGAQQRQFDYDANGNIISEQTAEGAASYQYGRLNRMLSHSKNGQTTHYSYNAKGQRSAKQLADGSRIHYLYDQQGRLIAEALNGSVNREYVYQNGQLLALVNLTDAGNEVYYLSNDHLGRPEVATDKYGEVAWQAKNLAFDREVLIDHVGGLNLGLPGQYYDSEKDSWQNGFRDYDAKTARYLQSDPIGLAGGNNLYRYALNSSLIWFDETGLRPEGNGPRDQGRPGGQEGSSSGCKLYSFDAEQQQYLKLAAQLIEAYKTQAGVIGAISNGYDLGGASATLLEAAINDGLRDINFFLSTEGKYHIPSSYVARVINWPVLQVNWNLYNSGNDSAEVIMNNFISSQLKEK